MRYRPFGRSGVVVSAVTLVIGDDLARRGQSRCVETIDMALEYGVNSFHIETAQPDAAIALGQSLSALERRLVFVSMRLGLGRRPLHEEAALLDQRQGRLHLRVGERLEAMRSGARKQVATTDGQDGFHGRVPRSNRTRAGQSPRGKRPPERAVSRVLVPDEPVATISLGSVLRPTSNDQPEGHWRGPGRPSYAVFLRVGFALPEVSPLPR